LTSGATIATAREDASAFFQEDVSEGDEASSRSVDPSEGPARQTTAHGGDLVRRATRARGTVEARVSDATEDMVDCIALCAVVVASRSR
jgi:hypothetical protein